MLAVPLLGVTDTSHAFVQVRALAGVSDCVISLESAVTEVTVTSETRTEPLPCAGQR